MVKVIPGVQKLTTKPALKFSPNLFRYIPYRDCKRDSLNLSNTMTGKRTDERKLNSKMYRRLRERVQDSGLLVAGYLQIE